MTPSEEIPPEEEGEAEKENIIFKQGSAYVSLGVIRGKRNCKDKASWKNGVYIMYTQVTALTELGVGL